MTDIHVIKNIQQPDGSMIIEMYNQQGAMVSREVVAARVDITAKEEGFFRKPKSKLNIAGGDKDGN